MKQEVIKWAKRIGEETAKRSPLILTVVAVAGAAATAVLAGEATLKAKAKLDSIKELEESGHEPFTTKEKAKNVVPIYIPTILMFTTTSACIIAAHQIDTKRQLALASAYSLSTEALKEVESKVKDTYGEKKLDKLKSEVNKDKAIHIYEANKDHAIDTGCGTQLFIDGASGQLFKSSREHINRVYNDVNAQLNEGYSLSINDINEMLGIRPMQMGDYLIYDINRTGILEPTFDPAWTDETQTETCTFIDYRNKPVLSYCEMER
jgi:hypothetical protein